LDQKIDYTKLNLINTDFFTFLFVQSVILILIKRNIMIRDIKLAEVFYVVIFNFAGFVC